MPSKIDSSTNVHASLYDNDIILASEADLKAWRQHPWRRPAMAESSGRAYDMQSQLRQNFMLFNMNEIKNISAWTFFLWMYI